MGTGEVVPYSMISGPYNYSDDVIKSDHHGFRYTKIKNKLISIDDLDKYDSVNLLVGGSTVFGVGATDDSKTLTSYLSELSDEPWFNLGIRGAVSLQEYIQLIRFIHKAKKVNNIVFFSGLNDIYINIVNEKRSFFDRRFGESSSSQFYSCKRQILSSILSKLYFTDQKDIINCSISDMFLYPFRKKTTSIEEKDLGQLTFSEKIDIIFDNYERNFLLYSGLKKELDCNVSFFLQPFFYWTGKKPSEKEKKIIEYLNSIQKKSAWGTYKDKLDINLYNTLVENFSKLSTKYKIDFFDVNKSFNIDDTLFVDSVHLNDDGYKLSANLVFKEVYNEKVN
jgi:lysophospholipase L1-like esterase